MGDFASSSRTLDQALAECPTYERAREVSALSKRGPYGAIGNVSSMPGRSVFRGGVFSTCISERDFSVVPEH